MNIIDLIIISLLIIATLGAAVVVVILRNLVITEARYADLLPQDVYRLTEAGINQAKFEIDTYEQGRFEVGTLFAVCDEWCLEIVDIKADGTVIVHDIHNFLNENFATTMYMDMVVQEPHKLARMPQKKYAPLPSNDDNSNMNVPF